MHPDSVQPRKTRLSWDTVLGHDEQRKWFSAALSRGRLATSFLFIGPEGIGKRTFALMLAKCFLCRHSEPDSLTCCDQCEDCAQVEVSTHPDLILVRKPDDKAFLPVDLLIGEKEKRMRSGLCHDISMRPYGGRRKIAIVDDADFLNVEGANCLLKTLEEPPVNSIMILLGTSLQRQLPTIRSRCQSIVFQKLTEDHLSKLLERYEIADDSNSARLASLCEGSLTQAVLLADPELQELLQELIERISKPEVAIVDLAKWLGGAIDAAGKDARVRRERLKLVFTHVADFFRALALADQGASEGANALDEKYAEHGSAWLRRGNRDRESALRCWERCLTAIEQVDRNANQASLLAAWSAEMALS